MTLFRTLLTSVALATLPGVAAAATATPVRNIVLVHGAFADGSGWQPVADILTRDGYTVSVVQEPLTSLADDVTATTRILERQNGPAVLVGHSYGGAVITEAGNNAHVAALVYVAGFVPDAGETIIGQIESNPPAADSIAPTADGSRGRVAIDRMNVVSAGDSPWSQTARARTLGFTCAQAQSLMALANGTTPDAAANRPFTDQWLEASTPARQTGHLRCSSNRRERSSADHREVLLIQHPETASTCLDRFAADVP